MLAVEKAAIQNEEKNKLKQWWITKLPNILAIYKPFTKPAGITDAIVEWEFKGLLNKKIILLLQQIIVFLQNWDGWIILMTSMQFTAGARSSIC